ncbi:Slam-dependent surface lipoprotein [Xenorhabdus innexi]|uniref:Uncharacterized protein n=1 Tax=Xenorhabdus innexi TaxID=290109 RepID=A0A1N6MXV6_9GAMM|nr:Slam-dependent surface lipoprotein [Xenorhabdus innexi]PHM38851.1 hypothetical protein Xinn_00137 [Xenorhabdus innexi]SIP73705.1 conserved exported hypothetical protein [Xenorhabdus innexi]
MKVVNIFIITMGALGLITQAHAKVGYGISQQETDPHLTIGDKGGEPALGISSHLGGALFPASILKNLATRDSNGVYRFKTPLYGHNKIDIAQIPGTEVYYGEWSHGSGAESDKTHTVFYAGKDVTTNMPKGGKATYKVSGISQYNGHNLLQGKMTADFDKQQLDGSLSNKDRRVDMHGNINSDAGFSGIAKDNGTNGTVDGKFFGNGASDIAGYAKFDSDRKKDIAFGGHKQ